MLKHTSRWNRFLDTIKGIGIVVAVFLFMTLALLPNVMLKVSCLKGNVNACMLASRR